MDSKTETDWDQSDQDAKPFSQTWFNVPIQCFDNSETVTYIKQELNNDFDHFQTDGVDIEQIGIESEAYYTTCKEEFFDGKICSTDSFENNCSSDDQSTTHTIPDSHDNNDFNKMEHDDQIQDIIVKETIPIEYEGDQYSHSESLSENKNATSMQISTRNVKSKSKIENFCEKADVNVKNDESTVQYAEVSVIENDYRCIITTQLELRLQLKRMIFFKENFICNTCYAIVPSSILLKQHKQLIHNEKVKKKYGKRHFKCLYCPYESVKSFDFKRHTKTHTGPKPYACDICPYKFTIFSHLKKHKIVHTDEKPHGCNYCSFRCRKSGDLKVHIRSHTGEKPFSCNLCPYKCSSRGGLRIHKKIHSGIKPNQCDLCPFKFVLSGDLKRHKMTHTGERPFTCDFCMYKSIRASELRNHYKIHHMNSTNDDIKE